MQYSSVFTNRSSEAKMSVTKMLQSVGKQTKPKPSWIKFGSHSSAFHIANFLLLRTGAAIPLRCVDASLGVYWRIEELPGRWRQL